MKDMHKILPQTKNWAIWVIFPGGDRFSAENCPFYLTLPYRISYAFVTPRVPFTALATACSGGFRGGPTRPWPRPRTNTDF